MFLCHVLADCGAQPTDAIDQYYLNGGGLNPPAAPVPVAAAAAVVADCNGAKPADYYVDGTTGNDGNPGTSAAPWESLTKAVSTLLQARKFLSGAVRPIPTH